MPEIWRGSAERGLVRRRAANRRGFMVTKWDTADFRGTVPGGVK
jgi:hypothetical protein